MSKSPVYGFPCVEDPNDFLPDPECCSTAEMAAHRIACTHYGTSAYEPNKGCYTDTDFKAMRDAISPIEASQA